MSGDISESAGEAHQSGGFADLFASQGGFLPAAELRVRSEDGGPVSTRDLIEASRRLGLPEGLIPCAAWILLVARLAGTAVVGLALRSAALGVASARVVKVDVPREMTVRAWLLGLPDQLAARDTNCAVTNPDASWSGSVTEPIDSVSPGVVSATLVGQVAVELHSRVPLLSADHLRSLEAAWRVILGSILNSSDTRIEAVEFLSPTDRKRLLFDLRCPPWRYSGTHCIGERFAQMVRQHPDRQALRWSGGQLTYAQLDAASDHLVRELMSAGLRPGEVVAVTTGRTPAEIASVLAVIKAGAAYLPVDPKYPGDRLAFMLSDAGVRIALTGRDVLGALPGQLTFVEPSLQTERHPQPLLPAALDGEALAYVMYTSGSTGTPKGVQIPHRAVMRLVMQPDFMRLDDQVVMLQAAPLGFDASTLEIWGPLLNGGCCVLHDEAVPTGPGLARAIAAHHVTTAWLTAALFNAVVDDDPRHLGGLTELLIGGEALSVPHVRRALAALPDLILINGYGPTECTTFTATHRIDRVNDVKDSAIPIGRPITETQLYVLNSERQLLPFGFIGELYVGGLGVGLGYLNRPELTGERFVDNRFDGGRTRLYRTGDLVRYREDGTLHFVGRVDTQVKVRGFRIELGEIETALAEHPSVRACAVIALADAERGTQLVAYVVPAASLDGFGDIRARLAARLPEFMLPTHYVTLDALPVTANGKLDRRALPAPLLTRPDDLQTPFIAPDGVLEQAVAAVFRRLLGVDRVGRLDNFFQLGGNSLLALRVLAALRAEDLGELPVAVLFGDPTIRGVAMHLAGAEAGVDPRRLARAHRPDAADGSEPIAIIGMAGRFPGARDVEAFWNVLTEGRDTITRFSAAELDPSIPAALRADPQYVPARGVLDDVEFFDASFFGITGREAELMDPQQRLFLELCWECLERGGHVPEKYSAPIGVFAGMYNASYFQKHVLAHPEKVERLGEFQVMLANEKDYIAPRAASRLNLTGPAVSVHSACSTSLVAIAQAVASLRSGQCGMVLAGGVSITCPPRSGYLYQDGSMLSPDGHTRTFDSEARGTVFSDGAAVVLLKPLADALADGNSIYAVIRGVAVNNDGAEKASFTAPSVDGQAAVVAAALASSGIDARTISYVEAHGTATPLGDPVELAALTRAFHRHTRDVGFCRIGSLKSNMGHLVIAAGATGVIKTALALAHESLPATLHYKAPNPQIDFANSPFVVNDRISAWPRGEQPRRAGVSSFGVGGTNAHAILEEAPLRAPSPAAAGLQTLRLSARSPEALQLTASRLADHLDSHPDVNLADVAFTLEHGRRDFVWRTTAVAPDVKGAVAAMRDRAAVARRSHKASGSPSVVLLFPGQGAQYLGMGSALYREDEVFRAAVDECAEGVQDFDLRAAMFSGDETMISQTRITQPATFCIEYALARTWLAAGLNPDVMIGHSIGEFAAAAIAGVMSPRDAIRLVALRGALMQSLPEGSMLSIRADSKRVESLLPPTVQMAAENGPAACVVSGPTPDIDALSEDLARREIGARKLRTSHAFHSSMMDPVVSPFAAAVRGVSLQTPKIRIVSTVTGQPLTDAEAQDPMYWARHLRRTVRFSPAVRSVLGEGRVFLEAGPRTTLTSLTRQHGTGGAPPVAIASLADGVAVETESLAAARAELWSVGVELATSTPVAGRRRVRLPTYPFERQRHWVDPVPSEQRMAPMPSIIPQSSTTLASSPMITPRIDRKERLAARVRELMEDVSGVEISPEQNGASFIEQGLDSLTLTQVALQLKKTFGLNVTFRNLMETYRSVDDLVAHLDEKLPPDAAPAESAAPIGVPMAAPALPAFVPAFAGPAVGGNLQVQQLIQQQMLLMAQQLALLSGTSIATPAVAAPTQPAMPVPAPAAASASNASAGPASGDDEKPEAMKKYDVKKAFGAIARIHTTGTELTERQRKRLDQFMARYIKRTTKSKAYTVEHRPHLADPRVVNGFRPQIKEIIYQIVIERSKGARMWDLDGNEYVDALNGFGMSLFGWQPDFILEAVRRQLDSGYDIGPQHPLAGEVAKLFCEVTHNDRAALCNTGSEAVMGCVRIARTVTGRSKIAIFNGAYHGIFDEVIVRGTKKLKSIPAAPGIMPNTSENVVVLDYGTPETLKYLQEHAEEFAAILVEPVQSRRPDFQPKEFLKQLRTLTEKSGTLLVFDEVVTGFRCHPGGIQALFDIRADLASYGKVVGGGFPIGVIAGKREYMDALDGGQWEYGDSSIPTVGVTYFAGTFVRHPLALVAAKAVLEHVKQHGPELQAALTQRTSAMVEELNAFCQEVGAPIVLKSFSSVWKTIFTEDHALQDLLFAMMRSRGIHILDNFPCFFTTAHTAADFAAIKTAFKESVLELQESDFIPKHAGAAADLFDAARPPVQGARLGRDAEGKPAWFVANSEAPGKYVRVEAK